MKSKILITLMITGVTLMYMGCGKETTYKNEDRQKPDTKSEVTEVSNKKSIDVQAERQKTIQNLKDAFKGETTASAKYMAYSKKAKEEGYTKIALLFEAVSNSEKIHAGNHKSALEELGEKPDEFTPEYTVKSTKENLEDAVKGETFEIMTMYPEYIRTANNGEVNIALLSLNYAYKTEMNHKRMYENALAALDSGKENSLPSAYWVCPTCGNTYDGQAPKRCSLSMTPSDRFISIQ